MDAPTLTPAAAPQETQSVKWKAHERLRNENAIAVMQAAIQSILPEHLLEPEASEHSGLPIGVSCSFKERVIKEQVAAVDSGPLDERPPLNHLPRPLSRQHRQCGIFQYIQITN